MTLRHGAGVETNDEGFVEGAWNGEFEAFDFDRAETLAGTGGRLRDGVFVIAAPFHPLERLFVLRRPDEILVSNSLVFLLREAGDKLDLSYPNYFFDLIAHVRRGIAPPAVRLRTAGGSAVELFPCCNLELHSDLTFRRTPKPASPPPTCFADYLGSLLETTKDLAANAVAPGRRTTYPLIAACSQGYDSTATAALASLAGCREGVTFAQSGRVVPHPGRDVDKQLVNDSGARSLRALGMNVTEYDRFEFGKLPGHPKAEFYFSPFAVTDASMCVMEDRLCGSLLVSGRHGERFWGVGVKWFPGSGISRREFRSRDDLILSGQNLGEFRLRAGFLHFPVPYVGGLHSPAIFRITHSEEMEPWKLGKGYYDRPIARRIAEEAGVPREYFGQQKQGGSDLSQYGLSGKSEQDFQTFLQSEVPENIRRRLDPRPLAARQQTHRPLKYIRKNYSRVPLAPAVMDLLQTDRLHSLWKSVYLYQFHWGFERIKNRYATD